jgi:hypothetical protein
MLIITLLPNAVLEMFLIVSKFVAESCPILFSLKLNPEYNPGSRGSDVDGVILVIVVSSVEAVNVFADDVSVSL